MPANPNEEKVKINLGGLELTTPFTIKEIKEHIKNPLTEEEANFLSNLEEKFYKNPKNFTKKQLDELIENTDPKFLKSVIYDFAERAEKPDSDTFSGFYLSPSLRGFIKNYNRTSSQAKIDRRLKQNEEYQDQYKHFINKLVKRYETSKKEEELAEKEKEKLETEKNKTRDTISSILENENLGKKFFKEASSEELEMFEKHYRPLVKQIFNTEELSNNAFEKIKKIKDKAAIEKKTAEKIAKQEAEKKALSEKPIYASETQESQPQARSRSRGRPLFRNVEQTSSKSDVATTSQKQSPKNEKEILLDIHDWAKENQLLNTEFNSDYLQNALKKLDPELIDWIYKNPTKTEEFIFSNTKDENYPNKIRNKFVEDFKNSVDTVRKNNYGIPLFDDFVSKKRKEGLTFKRDFERLVKEYSELVKALELSRQQEKLEQKKTNEETELESETELDPEVLEAYTKELPKATKAQVKVPQREMFPPIAEKGEDGEPLDIPTALESQALENRRQLANLRVSNPPELPQYRELPEASKEALAATQDFALRGDEETKQFAKDQKENLELIKKQENIQKALKVLETADDPETRELAKKLIKKNPYIRKAERLLSDQPDYRKDIEQIIRDEDYSTPALTALTSENYDTQLKDALEDVKYEEPEVTFDLSDQEQKLLNDKLAAFERQAQQNFEQNELRRHKAMYGHRGISGASGADNIRSKLFGDFYKYITDKKSDIAEQFHQQSFLRKKELADIRAKKAQIALSKAESWLKANELKNREKHAAVESFGKLQRSGQERAIALANYQKLLIEASQGNAQAMAVLGMNQNQSAAELNRIVTAEKDLGIRQAQGFSGVESARQGGAINYQNLSLAQRQAIENEKAQRRAAGFFAGDVIRNEQKEADLINYQNAQYLRDLPLQENEALYNLAASSRGNIPMQSLNPPLFLQTYPHVPSIPQPKESFFKDLTGLGMTAASLFGKQNAPQVQNQMGQQVASNDARNLGLAEGQRANPKG